jgi:hypothetical protein
MGLTFTQKTGSDVLTIRQIGIHMSVADDVSNWKTFDLGKSNVHKVW